MISDIRRILEIDLPRGQSAFLWGPRKTGKTTYLKERFPNAIVYDFLQTDLFLELTKEPALLRQRIAAVENEGGRSPIILDEVQKVPHVLDEVHWLIENRKVSFILCGSSARKLKRGHANMLGGRAWRYEMFPLVSRELPDLDLPRALNHGLIPAHYLQDDRSCRRSLRAYAQDYLKQEVFEEGLVRNIPAFSRFFDAAAFSHGEMVNYANIARDCAIDAGSVKEYFQILVDTLLGSLIEPYSRRQDRQVITRAPKFYLFDVGVAGEMLHRRIEEERGEAFGRAFEHFILMEILAYRSYAGKDLAVNYWRTKSGLEVDFILGGGEVAVEVKGSPRVDATDLRGIRTFTGEYRPRKAIVVSREHARRVVDDLSLIPWREFLQQLWNGDIIR